MGQGRVPAHRRGVPALLLVLSAVAMSVTGCDHEAAAPQLPVKLAFTGQPVSEVAGAPLGAVTVTVEDESGSPVSGVSDTVTLAFANATSGATLAGPVTAIATGGVATFSGLSIAKAGTYTLTATAPGYASATSAPFTISPGAAAKLAFVTQPGTAQGQVAFAPAVQVAIEDTLGNTVTGATGSVTVALGANPAGGTLLGAATVAASGGIATFSGLSVDDPGAGYTLTANSGTLTAATSAPFAVHVEFATISASSDHTCGLTAAGAAYCWGTNGRGELGTGNTRTSLRPAAVRGGLQFATVSAGPGFTCGVTTSGAAYCWGYGGDGELGNGTTAFSDSAPTAVSGGLSFTTVVSGGFSNCALTAAGAAYCWGANNYGQLGDSSFAFSSVPVAVSGGRSFSAIAAGFAHVCGLTAGGAAYCWGDNSNGQLGNGTNTLSNTPVPVSGSLAFTQLSPGTQHTCGVVPTNDVYCWGYNGDGEFGDGTTNSSNTPAFAAGAAYLNLTSVSVERASTCALTSTGAAVCWGAGNYGQLGDGSSSGTLLPGAVLGGHTFKTLAAASVGDDVCGVTTAGAVYCWGFNAVGQLGDGTTGENLVPVAVIQ